jgi:hypothetical protein
VLAIDLTHLFGYRIDWGSVPAWLGAILTPLSVYVAFQALRHTRRLSESEQARAVVGSYEIDKERLFFDIANLSDK